MVIFAFADGQLDGVQGQRRIKVAELLPG